MGGAYDLAIIGGGMGGAALAKVMAEHGARVLVLEKDRAFKDRVRGDAMAPWGVPEARALGIETLLLETCGHLLPWVDCYLGTIPIEHRHLPTTTACQTSELAFYHPAMQEVLLQAAADAGATIARGAVAREIRGGQSPGVGFILDGTEQFVNARLVVGADGRQSASRRLGQFAVHADPAERILAGVLMEGMSIRQDTCVSIFDAANGQLVALFPQGNDRVRAYFSYPHQLRPRLQGASDVSTLIALAQQACAPAHWFADATAIGPLASFPSDDHWVPHPYRAGVALIGDAAACNDPMYGQGMALTLRDVRVLWQQLAATDDWEAAGHAYAAAHDEYFHVVHTFSHWFETLFYQTGTAGNVLRARVLPLVGQDSTRIPDYLMSGPDGPVTEAVRRRMFCEDLHPPLAERGLRPTFAD